MHMTNKGPAQEAYCLVRETDTYQVNTKIIKFLLWWCYKEVEYGEYTVGT